jgi:hypothetical protein
MISICCAQSIAALFVGPARTGEQAMNINLSAACTVALGIVFMLIVAGAAITSNYGALSLKLISASAGVGYACQAFSTIVEMRARDEKRLVTPGETAIGTGIWILSIMLAIGAWVAL